MPTLFTDPRSGGVKKSSGVRLLPQVAECWSEVRDDSSEVNWLIIGYEGSSKTDVTVLEKGTGGLEECSANLPSQCAVFGGVRLSSGRFVTFFYASEGTSVMQKGRASMHKNGVFNVLEGSDGEIDIEPNHNEADVALPVNGGSRGEIKVLAKVNEKKLYTEAQEHAGDSADHKPIHAGNSRDHENLHDKPSSLQQIETLPEKESEKAQQNKDDADKLHAIQDSEGIPYSLLKGIGDVSLLPEGVDPLKREMALSEQDFQEMFGMDKESFSKLPTWKKTNLKKKALLF